MIMIHKVRRIFYFAYYLRRMDWTLLAKFMAHLKVIKGWSKPKQWRLVLRDSLKFNVSILEFYQFHFYKLSDIEKERWAGTGTMYEFQMVANPPNSRRMLSDKGMFYRNYKQFFRHELFSLADLRQSPEIVEKLLSQNEKLVLKSRSGSCGEGVHIEQTAGWTPDYLLQQMSTKDLDIVETFLDQHTVLQTLSPSAVNTIRVFTQINRSNDFEILGCRLRISVNSPVDNLAAGNMAAAVDANTGQIVGPGVYSDITKDPAFIHPVTDEKIIGLQLPFWLETLEMVKEASHLHPENRSVGWDVVITDDGPGLIEGNHDWCKLVWQLPVGKGLKHRLDM